MAAATMFSLPAVVLFFLAQRLFMQSSASAEIKG